ncbi:hypothetical protein Lesp02_60070 [Lentzea sp. NBRC 105346]|uniref:hypothetical protein n=1 Tax=Lentzea sp. NBRC 105346 TaxID=3032205 RepID=UPI0024A08501|nr:hypothetical protein [Lentzea sp. NBRC 105346]GLZ33819.1 hypothetical protein Lesp02_60070 [Lentzea sp. NBRC 105346]
MRRSVGYLSAWAVATTVAVGLSWLGIRSALDSGVTAEPQALVSTDGGQPAIVDAPSITEVASPAPTTVSSSVAPPAAPTPVPGPPPATRANVPTTTTTAAKAPAAQPDQGVWQSDGSYVRSFQLKGGEVTARFTPQNVEAMSAVPHEGYSVSVEQPGGPLVVNFRTTSGRLSRLEATWGDGPTWKIIEQ